MFLVLFGEGLGFDPAISTDMVMVLPGLVITFAGFLISMTVRGLYLIPGCGCIGVGLAVLLGQMNSQSLLTAELLQNSTIYQAQMVVIVGCLVIGTFMGARR